LIQSGCRLGAADPSAAGSKVPPPMAIVPGEAPGVAWTSVERAAVESDIRIRAFAVDRVLVD
jgi:hypothetical protein